MTNRQKRALAILIAVALIVIVAAGAVTFFYVKYYKPLFMANGAAAISARLENTLTNKDPYLPPQSGELTAEQVSRFATVEERVQDQVGTRIAVFAQQEAALERAPNGPTSREIHRAFGEIGNVYLRAKKIQMEALNDVAFSKAEYEWVRERVYTAAGLPFARVELPEILIDPGNLDRVIPLRRAPRNAFVAPANVALVGPYIAKLREWTALAFFDL